MDAFDFKHDILMREWQLVNDGIGRLDTVIFLIRGWAVTITTGGVAYAFVQQHAIVPIYIVVPLLLTWAYDALFKSFQSAYISRNLSIEKYLSSDQFLMDFREHREISFKTPATLDGFWYDQDGMKPWSVIRENANRNNVRFVYGCLIGLCLLSSLIIVVQRTSS